MAEAYVAPASSEEGGAAESCPGGKWDSMRPAEEAVWWFNGNRIGSGSAMIPPSTDPSGGDGDGGDRGDFDMGFRSIFCSWDQQKEQ